VKASREFLSAAQRSGIVLAAAAPRSDLSGAGLRFQQAQLGGRARGELAKAISIGLRSGGRVEDRGASHHGLDRFPDTTDAMSRKGCL
jgi:hypothetical protein